MPFKTHKATMLHIFNQCTLLSAKVLKIKRIKIRWQSAIFKHFCDSTIPQSGLILSLQNSALGSEGTSGAFLL